jgi:CheY-like chemotaxis protein
MKKTTSHPSRSHLPSRSNISALIVDDDAFQLDLLTQVLRAVGVLDVSTASSADKGLRLLAAGKSRINLILLDLHMQGMDGFAMMDEMAKTAFTGDLIIVSDQSEDVLRAGALVAKLRRFSLLGTVSKPVDISALSALLSR